MASTARREARKLQSLPYAERRNILYNVAAALVERKEEILLANRTDLDQAERNNTDAQLVNRLKLDDTKLNTLAMGIRQIADQTDPLNVVKTKRELAEGLILDQITVPIGVLMIIFESRPDSMPQISALALASGNGLYDPTFLNNTYLAFDNEKQSLVVIADREYDFIFFEPLSKIAHQLFMNRMPMDIFNIK